MHVIRNPLDRLDAERHGSLNLPGLAGWTGLYHIGTMRMHMRGFTGPTNAFSKKIEMIDASLPKPGKRGSYKIKETMNVV